METFNFLHTASAPIFPKGDSYKFGRGYEFSAAPQLPVQRRFKLFLEAVIWEKNDSGAYDASVNPDTNALALIQFYERHYSHKAFTYIHPVFGSMTVKFASDVPLEVPRAVKGGSGVTESFEITVVEQPL